MMKSVIVYNLEDPLSGSSNIALEWTSQLPPGDMDTRGVAAFKTQEVDCVRALHKMFEHCPNV